MRLPSSEELKCPAICTFKNFGKAPEFSGVANTAGISIPKMSLAVHQLSLTFCSSTGPFPLVQKAGVLSRFKHTLGLWFRSSFILFYSVVYFALFFLGFLFCFVFCNSASYSQPKCTSSTPCNQGWPWTSLSYILCFLRARITTMCAHSTLYGVGQWIWAFKHDRHTFY